MNTQDFSSVKVGDKLWSIQLGECEVSSINSRVTYGIGCLNYEGQFALYDFKGNSNNTDHIQSLFFSTPNITAPPKPKRMVKKEIKGWVIEYSDHHSVFHKLQPQDTENKFIFPATLTYEIEET